jgi:hypothetical protein
VIEWRNTERQLRESLQFASLETKTAKEELEAAVKELQHRSQLLDVCAFEIE